MRFLLVLCGLLAFASLVRAQPVKQIAPKTGYTTLLEARVMLKDGPNGEPSTTEKLTPEENLRRQRLAVKRNEEVLAKFREALQLGIEAPLPRNNEEILQSVEISSSLRELARLLAQEADVRAADGNFLGSAQSSLDALELGAQFGRGSFLNWLVGQSFMSIGRRPLERHAARLNAEEIRQIIARWETINTQRSLFSDVLLDEEEYAVSYSLDLWAEHADRREMIATLKETGVPVDLEEENEVLTPAQIEILEALTPEMLEANLRHLYAQARERATLPYQVAVQAAPLRGADPYTTAATYIVNSPDQRFSYESRRLNDHLALAALRLRAIKLETGAYPETFNAGADPFSPTLAPLVYRREGNSFLLYSVGPDGKDNDGSEIQTLETNQKTGIKTVSGRLMPDSTGDILAPVF